MIEPEKAETVILGCALKHRLTEEEIRAAWRNPASMRYRNFDIPSIVAAAGADSHGQLIEMLGGVQEDGTVLIFHAMRLTKKMADELGL